MPHRSPRRFPAGIRAPGEQFQERVCFSHYLDRCLCPGKLGGELLVLFSQPVVIHLRLAARGPPGWLTGKAFIAGLTPLLDVGVIQALAAQQRPPVARIGKLVVLLDDRQLVGRGEGPPPGPVSPRTPRGGHQAILPHGRRHVCNGQCHVSRRSRLALLTTELYFIPMSHGSLTERVGGRLGSRWCGWRREVWLEFR